jgi:hypothetical protein
MLLTDKFNSVSRVQDVSAKTLILIAEKRDKNVLPVSTCSSGTLNRIATRE